MCSQGVSSLRPTLLAMAISLFTRHTVNSNPCPHMVYSPASWTVPVNSGEQVFQVWWGRGEAQQRRSCLFQAPQLIGYKRHRPAWLECEATAALWAREWHIASLILVSDPLRYFYALNIWHLKDEKCVLLHNDFSPSLMFSNRRLSLSICPHLQLLKSVDGKTAKISWPPPQWDLCETGRQGSGWGETSKGDGRPIMRFAFWSCFRDFEFAVITGEIALI